MGEKSAGVAEKRLERQSLPMVAARFVLALLFSYLVIVVGFSATVAVPYAAVRMRSYQDPFFESLAGGFVEMVETAINRPLVNAGLVDRMAGGSRQWQIIAAFDRLPVLPILLGANVLIFLMIGYIASVLGLVWGALFLPLALLPVTVSVLKSEIFLVVTYYSWALPTMVALQFIFVLLAPLWLRSMGRRELVVNIQAKKSHINARPPGWRPGQE